MALMKLSSVDTVGNVMVVNAACVLGVVSVVGGAEVASPTSDVLVVATITLGPVGSPN